jgi:hypothetical protein
MSETITSQKEKRKEKEKSSSSSIIFPKNDKQFMEETRNLSSRYSSKPPQQPSISGRNSFSTTASSQNIDDLNVDSNFPEISKYTSPSYYGTEYSSPPSKKHFVVQIANEQQNTTRYFFSDFPFFLFDFGFVLVILMIVNYKAMYLLLKNEKSSFLIIIQLRKYGTRN